MRQFLDPYDTRLNQYCQELSVDELSSPSTKSIINDMIRIAKGERDEVAPSKATLVGLSAPQIGEMVRIILVDTAADPTMPNFKPDLKLFINPRIVSASVDENLGREGCYSTGKIGGAVYRAASVVVEAVDEAGDKLIYESANTFVSAILQHEIDHLNGIRFPSRVRSPEQLHLIELSDFQEYRKNWMTWHKTYPFENWLKMYRGEK